MFLKSKNIRNVLANTCGQSEHPICTTLYVQYFRDLWKVLSCKVLITTVSCHLSLLCTIKYISVY